MCQSEAYLAMQFANQAKFEHMMRKDLKSVGIDQFDAEHRDLLEAFFAFQIQMEEFRQGNITDKGWLVVDETLTFLETYVEDHLAEEERLMQMAEVPGYVVHKAAHDILRKMIRDYRERYEDRDDVGMLYLKYDLFKWFFHHVNTMDVLYEPHIAHLVEKEHRHLTAA